MAVTHNKAIRDYSNYLKLHPEEVGELVKAFLINVTQFFRDADAFAYLKSDILPALIVRARQRDHVLRSGRLAVQRDKNLIRLQCCSQIF